MAYATSNDLASYLGADAPANADYLLDLASEVVDELLIGCWYETDDDEVPTDPAVDAALRRATCAQAVYMAAVGDETGAQSQFTKVRIGDVEATRGSPSTGSNPAQTTYAPNAVRALRVAGLTPFVMSW